MRDPALPSGTYAVPTDWREARMLVRQWLDAWQPTDYQRRIVWSIVEGENVAAALHYIEQMRELEVSDADR